MNLLLDTHTFLWAIDSPKLLPGRIEQLLSNNTSIWFLSLASVWEIQIKSELGKLRLSLPLSELIETQQQTNDLRLLPIELSHIYALSGLPHHHRDPFDRLLITQARVERLPLLSRDSIFDAYDLERIWI
ncbi:MAG: type II toxin-antitoxin system VapC family toxin [Kovacikia sp.]